MVHLSWTLNLLALILFLDRLTFNPIDRGRKRPFETYIITKLQWNSVVTNSVVNEHSAITNSVVNKHLVITNRFLGQIGHFRTQINPLITNKMAGSELFVITEFSFPLFFRHFYSIDPSSLEKWEIVKLSPRLDRNNNHVTNDVLSYTHKKSIFSNSNWNCESVHFELKKMKFSIN